MVPEPVAAMLNVAVPPGQMVVVPLNAPVGRALTVVVFESLPEHPFPSVTVTVKVFAELTVIVCVVAPVDQL